MKVLVSGSHGLVGTELVKVLAAGGHEVVRLSRKQAGPGEIAWDPDAGKIDESALEGFDAVVHLAGDNIATERWTDAKKARIRQSRVDGTKLLCRALASRTRRPGVLVSSSAIGIYGDRGNEVLTETAIPGQGFLAEVCKDWEAATQSAEDAGIRVVKLRIGMVLAREGGALSKMVPPFQMGVGGVFGSGKQYMSWIGVSDLAGIIEYCLSKQDLSGPVNAVTPQAVTNEEFTRALGTALSRPTIFPVPGFAAHLLMGEMADELILASTRVSPSKLIASDYNFKQSELLPTLKQLLD